jgi:hypothetical protein
MDTGNAPRRLDDREMPASSTSRPDAPLSEARMLGNVVVLWVPRRPRITISRAARPAPTVRKRAGRASRSSARLGCDDVVGMLPRCPRR